MKDNIEIKNLKENRGWCIIGLIIVSTILIVTNFCCIFMITTLNPNFVFAEIIILLLNPVIFSNFIFMLKNIFNYNKKLKEVNNEEIR